MLFWFIIPISQKIFPIHKPAYSLDDRRVFMVGNEKEIFVRTIYLQTEIQRKKTNELPSHK